MRHRRAMSLLPWYANGTLEPSERRAVEAHLEACPACARELVSLGELRRAVAAAEEPDPSPDLLPRTLARIEDFERRRAQAAAEPGWLESFNDWMTATAEALWTPLPAPARLVMAVQLALVLVLAGALITNRPAPELTTLSGPTPGNEERGARLTVAFAPEIAEEVLRRTLLDVGATIVSGPSAAGFYVVEVAIPPDRPAQIEELVEALRARRDVIRFAAREGASP